MGSMMSAIRKRRQPWSAPSDAMASRPMDSGYDTNRLRAEETLERVLPGYDPASGCVDIDETEESDAAGLLELDGAELIAGDITVPVYPEKTRRIRLLALLSHTTHQPVGNFKGRPDGPHRLRVVKPGPQE